MNFDGGVGLGEGATAHTGHSGIYPAYVRK